MKIITDFLKNNLHNSISLFYFVIPKTNTMTHDLEFDDFIVYFENPHGKVIEITKITDFEDNVIEKSNRELDRIHKQIFSHCEYNDWFGEREKFTYVDEWFAQNIDFDKARGII